MTPFWDPGTEAKQKSGAIFSLNCLLLCVYCEHSSTSGIVLRVTTYPCNWFRHHPYGSNTMSAQLLEVFLLGVRTVLRLERDVRSMIK